MVHPGRRDRGSSADGRAVGADGQKMFRGGERQAQAETPKAAAKQLVREPAVAGCFIRKTRPNCHE